MKKNLIVFFMLLFPLLATAQYRNEPTDYLSSEFHKERREELRKKLPDNSVAVFFANAVRNRANDVDYVYHPDPDLFYLTGYREPNSVLLVFSEPIEMPDGAKYNELFFVQPRDERSELWNGERLGVERVKERLGMDNVFPNLAFEGFGVDFGQFNQVLLYGFKDDVRDNPHDQGDLFSLIEQFKDKAHYPKFLNEYSEKLYTLIETADVESSANVSKVIGREMSSKPLLKLNPVLVDFVKADTPEGKLSVASKIPSTNINLTKLHEIMGSLREVKTAEEMVLLTKAVKVSAVGQREVMKAIKPGMSEREIQGIHEFVFKKYNAEDIGYASIVGAGHNGCVLHYIANNKSNTEDGELILMDLGAQYRGYTADVTRTVPVNGEFSPEQKAIYDLVYKAQEAGIEACRKGNDFSATYVACAKVIEEGLLKLGIIEEGEGIKAYLPHGVSHHIGLDVHDKGNYGSMMPNMVITVEPGIYIPENSKCDPKWWGIAVRIEDDILITEKDPVNLSGDAPRQWQEIEKLMKEESPLDDFVLPTVD
ncbi:aminopeptidase P N-terminal domain-containing protein [Limibacter armeniacum]|uniref:aminopeptidase P family protein n=1 Tax=Limibacter armeniacum TaxID=466084 RepID=UPI002FE69BD6